MYHIYIYMIHDNQGSPFVLFKKDYNKDCFWILFLRKGLSIRRGVMVIHLEKDCNKDSFWILFLRKGLGIRRGVGACAVQILRAHPHKRRKGLIWINRLLGKLQPDFKSFSNVHSYSSHALLFTFPFNF